MKKWLKRIGLTLFILFILLNTMAAFHAWRFTHFYKDGVKPPVEINFWEKISPLFFGINYPKSVIIDTLDVPHVTVGFFTEDSLKLEAWYLSHSSDSLYQHKGTVLVFHGHASNRSGVIEETKEFFNLGYDVLSTDFRAHGNRRAAPAQ
ncbi:MAG TPA: hypothetical protein DCQ93_05165 [Bacteroidetes bacterium]|nr:hypothetical protein [Bacteroidota bacterium]